MWQPYIVDITALLLMRPDRPFMRMLASSRHSYPVNGSHEPNQTLHQQWRAGNLAPCDGLEKFSAHEGRTLCCCSPERRAIERLRKLYLDRNGHCARAHHHVDINVFDTAKDIDDG